MTYLSKIKENIKRALGYTPKQELSLEEAGYSVSKAQDEAFSATTNALENLIRRSIKSLEGRL
ncbi:MAG: hypothetical protein Q8R00_00570 [Candidatus Nanoarchaeia archaeon]|nr:hypothetical protein [Candidatus Nanoarchaeia archaeon]